MDDGASVGAVASRFASNGSWSTFHGIAPMGRSDIASRGRVNSSAWATVLESLSTSQFSPVWLMCSAFDPSGM